MGPCSTTHPKIPLSTLRHMTAVDDEVPVILTKALCSLDTVHSSTVSEPRGFFRCLL
jgi:hypothetical protein